MNCDAVIYHGPGHQSRARCRVEGPHDIHEAVYGEFDQYAEWRDGSYLARLADAGLEPPKWVTPGTAMTGFFDEPPEDVA